MDAHQGIAPRGIRVLRGPHFNGSFGRLPLNFADSLILPYDKFSTNAMQGLLSAPSPVYALRLFYPCSFGSAASFADRLIGSPITLQITAPLSEQGASFGWSPSTARPAPASCCSGAARPRGPAAAPPCACGPCRRYRPLIGRPRSARLKRTSAQAWIANLARPLVHPHCEYLAS